VLNRHERQHGEVIVKRGSRRHDDESHGGAWKVAFADFCLALMCLFLVLWVLVAMQKEELEKALGRGTATSVVRSAQGSYMLGQSAAGVMIPREAAWHGASGQGSRSHATGPSDTLDSADALHRLSQHVRAIAREVGLEDNLATMVTAQGLRVLLHDTDGVGMFELGSDRPSPKFALLLQRLGPMFARIGNQMLLIGHTDARPFASSGPDGASNWSLSASRALAARRELLLGGMPDHTVLQVVGMADQSPLAANDGYAAANRRVEMLVMTQAHARYVAAAHGALPHSEPLVPGTVSSPAATPVLRALRELLLSGRTAAGHE
jgi:chemotaxis protein MotB